jgi:hypothetical protein
MYFSDDDLPLRVLERELEFMILESSPSDRPNELAIGLRAAKHAGASASRLAALTGLSRQAIYDNLKRRPTGPGRDMRYVIGATILKGAQTPRSLADLLAVPWHDLEDTVAGLRGRQILKNAVAPDGASVFLRGDRAVDALREHLEDRRWVQLERYSMYLALADAEVSAVGRAAEEVLGAQRFTIIRKGTASHIVTDELAFGVAADERRDALATAQSLWEQIRGVAGLAAAPAVIADVIDPVRRAAA